MHCFVFITHIHNYHYNWSIITRTLPAAVIGATIHFVPFSNKKYKLCAIVSHSHLHLGIHIWKRYENTVSNASNSLKHFLTSVCHLHAMFIILDTMFMLLFFCTSMLNTEANCWLTVFVMVDSISLDRPIGNLCHVMENHFRYWTLQHISPFLSLASRNWATEQITSTKFELLKLSLFCVCVLWFLCAM